MLAELHCDTRGSDGYFHETTDEPAVTRVLALVLGTMLPAAPTDSDYAMVLGGLFARERWRYLMDDYTGCFDLVCGVIKLVDEMQTSAARKLPLTTAKA